MKEKKRGEQTLPCFNCGTESTMGLWKDGYFFCEECSTGGEERIHVQGVGPDSPIEENPHGGRQSRTLYDMSQIPALFLLTLSGLLKEGGEKYDRWNWLMLPTREHLNHAEIHVQAHQAGDTQEDHLLHAACRLMFAWSVKNGVKPNVEG